MRVSYILRRWKFYMDNRNNLGYWEKRDAKVFFNALKVLSPDEVELLAEKYYINVELANWCNQRGVYQSAIPVIDSVLAERKGLAVYSYQRQRRAIEDRLQDEMNRLKEEYAKEPKPGIDEIQSKRVRNVIPPSEW